MAMTSTSMAARIHTYMAAVPAAQVAGDGSIDTYRVALLQAFCAGIIDEIHAAGVVNVATSDTDTHGDAGTGTGVGTLA